MDSIRARALLSDLVERDLVEAKGTKGGRTYRLIHEWLSNVVKPRQPGNNAHDVTVANRGSNQKNVALILATLGSKELTAKEISQETALSERRFNYALRQLVNARMVYREGGRGKRRTTYSVTES